MLDHRRRRRPPTTNVLTCNSSLSRVTRSMSCDAAGRPLFIHTQSSSSSPLFWTFFPDIVPRSSPFWHEKIYAPSSPRGAQASCENLQRNFTMPLSSNTRRGFLADKFRPQPQLSSIALSTRRSYETWLVFSLNVGAKRGRGYACIRA